MKGVITLATLLISVTASAENLCVDKAVRSAKENAVKTYLPHAVEVLQAKKDYLEKYNVVLTNASLTKFEEIEITLMKSDCSVVSVIPDL
jgi:hypothetical protein